MAKIEIDCTTCNKKVLANVGESALHDTLRWYQSYQCENCGAAVEADDVGLPPDCVRAAIIDETGEWNVVLDDESSKALAVKVVRNALGLSLAESKQILKNFPCIYAGTKAECNWINRLLAAENVLASLNSKNSTASS